MKTIKLGLVALFAALTLTSCEEETFELSNSEECYEIIKNIQQPVDGGLVHEYFIKNIETGRKAIVYSYTISSDEDLNFHMGLTEGSTWCAFYNTSKFTEKFEPKNGAKIELY